MNCKNCGRPIEGNFCSYCGQKSNVTRINLSSVLNEISERVLQIDNGIVYTLRALTTRPGKSIQNFLDGKRKRHFKPIAYLVTLSTLYYLIAQATDQNTFIGDIVTGFIRGSSETNTEDHVPALIQWLINNYAYTSLLLLPLFSLASFIAFSGFGKTYLEHIVINAYITGHQALIYSLFLVARAVVDSDILEVLPIVGSLIYTYWAYWQLFTEGHRFTNLFRTTLTYLFYLILSTLMLLIVLAPVDS